MKTYLIILLLVSTSTKKLSILDPEQLTKFNVSKFPNFSKLKGWANAISDMWDSITSAFGTKQWNYIKEIKKQSGYQRLVLNTVYSSAVGARLSAWDTVWTNELEEIKLEEKNLENFKTTIEFARFSEKEDFEIYTNAYTDGNRNIRLVNSLINVRENAKKFDYVIFDMKLGFKLAPDLIIRCKGSSRLGGLVYKEGYEIEELEKTLSTEQTVAIVKYFKMLSLQTIAGLVGVSLKLPYEN